MVFKIFLGKQIVTLPVVTQLKLLMLEKVKKSFATTSLKMFLGNLKVTLVILLMVCIMCTKIY